MEKGDWFDDFMIMKMMEEDEKKESEEPRVPPTFAVPCGGFFPVDDEDDEEDDEEEGEDEEDEEAEEEEEEDKERKARLKALEEELAALQDELSSVEWHEPSNGDDDASRRWEYRRDLLLEQIDDVEYEIAQLE